MKNYKTLLGIFALFAIILSAISGTFVQTVYAASGVKAATVTTGTVKISKLLLVVNENFVISGTVSNPTARYIYVSVKNSQNGYVNVQKVTLTSKNAFNLTTFVNRKGTSYQIQLWKNSTLLPADLIQTNPASLFFSVIPSGTSAVVHIQPATTIAAGDNITISGTVYKSKAAPVKYYAKLTNENGITLKQIALTLNTTGTFSFVSNSTNTSGKLYVTIYENSSVLQHSFKVGEASAFVTVVKEVGTASIQVLQQADSSYKVHYDLFQANPIVRYTFRLARVGGPIWTTSASNISGNEYVEWSVLLSGHYDAEVYADGVLMQNPQKTGPARLVFDIN